jgi:hypothetical protein
MQVMCSPLRKADTAQAVFAMLPKSIDREEVTAMLAETEANLVASIAEAQNYCERQGVRGEPH